MVFGQKIRINTDFQQEHPFINLLLDLLEDILTSSNFERLLADLFGSDRTRILYHEFAENGKFELTDREFELLKSIGVSAVEIKEKFSQDFAAKLVAEKSYQLCPHAAVGKGLTIDNSPAY